MYRSRKSAYYSTNDSYSRSFNAECAEDEGRLPRTRAAASLELSVAAFDAGCRAVGYIPTEWHHVGKYAMRVDYYDCEELALRPEFWAGAAATYKSAKKQAEVLATPARMMAEREAAAKAERLEFFRAKLIRQRDCTRPVTRHSALDHWKGRCAQARINSNIPVGDLVAFAAAVTERQRRDTERAERLAQREREAEAINTILAERFTPATDDLGRECFTLDGNVHVRPHAGGVNIWHRMGGETHRSITPARAMEVIEKKLAKVPHVG